MGLNPTSDNAEDLPQYDLAVEWDVKPNFDLHNTPTNSIDQATGVLKMKSEYVQISSLCSFEFYIQLILTTNVDRLHSKIWLIKRAEVLY